MKLPFKLPVGFAFAQNNLRFPLWMDGAGNFFANVSVPGLNIPDQVSVMVNLGSTNMIANSGDYRIGGQLELHPADGIGSVFTWNDETMIATDEEVPSVLTIGPNSELARIAGSVAIIRNGDTRGEIVIGSTLDQFRDSCIPGSLMQIQFSHNNRVNGSLSILESTPTMLSQIAWSPVPRSQLQLSIPIIEDLLVVLLTRGADATDEDYVFSNCSQDVIADLPNINLFIQTSNGGISRLVLFPEDYASVSEGICRLRIAIANDGVPKFNPLQISNLNIRVSRNNVMEICDSSGI